MHVCTSKASKLSTCGCDWSRQRRAGFIFHPHPHPADISTTLQEMCVVSHTCAPSITHTSAYVSIRQHTSAYASIRQERYHTPVRPPPFVSIRQHTPAYASIHQRIRQHIRQHTTHTCAASILTRHAPPYANTPAPHALHADTPASVRIPPPPPGVTAP